MTEKSFNYVDDERLREVEEEYAKAGERLEALQAEDNALADQQRKAREQLEQADVDLYIDRASQRDVNVLAKTLETLGSDRKKNKGLQILAGEEVQRLSSVLKDVERKAIMSAKAAQLSAEIELAESELGVIESLMGIIARWWQHNHEVNRLPDQARVQLRLAVYLPRELEMLTEVWHQNFVKNIGEWITLLKKEKQKLESQIADVKEKAS